MIGDLKLDTLVKLKSDETTGNLSNNVRKSIRHRDLASDCHHNRHSGVEVTAGDVTANHDSDGQRSTDSDGVAGGDDDIEEKDSSEELNQILVQH